MHLISLPPHDDEGRVILHDHEEINNSDEVIRRVSEEQIVKKEGKRIISSILYKPSSGKNGGMSVDLKQLIENDGIDPKVWVTTPKWMGSVIFKVVELRDLDFIVGYDPLPKNPYHGEVWGTFSRSRVKKLKSLAHWLVPIEDTNLR